jgi:hypothetical protein
MAGVEMIGKDVLIEISRDEGVTWLPIVCLQDVTLSTSTEPLTTSNRCRGKFSASRPNTISYTIDGRGSVPSRFGASVVWSHIYVAND